MTKTGWQIVDWDGNPSLGFRCYRKKFGRGKVSVGIGEFDLVVFSYGANSDDSYSSTRHRKEGILTEQEAMEAVDRGQGKRMVF